MYPAAAHTSTNNNIVPASAAPATLSDDDCAEATPVEIKTVNNKLTSDNRLQHAFMRMPSFGLKNRTGPSVSPELRASICRNDVSGYCLVLECSATPVRRVDVDDSASPHFWRTGVPFPPKQGEVGRPQIVVKQEQLQSTVSPPASPQPSRQVWVPLFSRTPDRPLPIHPLD